MNRLCRTCSFLALCVVFACLARASAQDTKDDPLVGKWKVTGPPAADAKNFEQLAKLGLHISFEFKADGVLVLDVGGGTPDIREAMKKAGFPVEAKWRTLDSKVEVYSPKGDVAKGFFKQDKLQSEITFNKDKTEVTMKDPNGTTTKLTRIKDVKDKNEK